MDTINARENWTQIPASVFLTFFHKAVIVEKEIVYWLSAEHLNTNLSQGFVYSFFLSGLNKID